MLPSPIGRTPSRSFKPTSLTGVQRAFKMDGNCYLVSNKDMHGVWYSHPSTCTHTHRHTIAVPSFPRIPRHPPPNTVSLSAPEARAS